MAVRQVYGPAAQVRHTAGRLKQRRILLTDILRALQIVDIGTGSEPVKNISCGVQLRRAADEPPAVGAVFATEARLGLERQPGLPGTLTVFHEGSCVIRMECGQPAFTEARFAGETRVFRPVAIETDVGSVRPGDPDDERD